MKIPYGIINNSQTDFKRKRNGMLDFVRKAFRGGLEVILWINLILSTVIGGIAGYYLGQLISYRNAGGFAFGGVLIGIILGLLTDIILGGFIATILNMDKNLEKIVRGDSSLDSDEELVEKQKEGKIENEIINDNGNNAGKIKLIVERGHNVICSAIPFEVFIDKRKVFSIENAARVVDFLDNGSHSIYASLDYNTQSETINFNTDSSEIRFKLSVLGVGKIKLEKLV